MPVLRLISLVVLGACVLPAAEPEPAPEPPDPAVIEQKIATLGLRDDTLADQERPEHWLPHHWDAALPGVIKGLDRPEPRVAQGCLKLLAQAAPREAIQVALRKVAESADHPLAGPALVALGSYAADPTVKAMLTEGVTDVRRLPNPADRATLAEAVGDSTAAAQLLLPLIAQNRDRTYAQREIIQRLGRIGNAAATPTLATIAAAPFWELAAAARQALARIDPRHYGLTRDQAHFLDHSWRRFKTDRDTERKRWGELAALNRQEIRPLVLDMLASDQPEPALIILTVWQDRDALPEIKRLFAAEKSWRRADFAVAWLSLAPAETAAAELAANLTAADVEYVIRRVSEAPLPPERKLRFFRELRTTLCHDRPELIPAHFHLPATEITTVLLPLLRQETAPAALARYAENLVQAGTIPPWHAEIAGALWQVLKAQPPVKWRDAAALSRLMEAVAAAGLPNLGFMVNPLLADRDVPEPVQIRAAQVAARCGGDRARALGHLHAFLGVPDPALRADAVKALAAIPCRDDAEWAARETAVLELLGKPAETDVLRLLTSCGGAVTARQLTPLLDEDDTARALYAAWVLAQCRDQTAKTKGLRRLAIYAMFNHQEYQQGAGIDFRITRNISFHQVTEAFRSGAYENLKDPGPQLPQTMLLPLVLDPAEQAFSVRAYRHTILGQFRRTAEILSHWEWRGKWNLSYTPLLEVMAREDPQLVALHVAGQPVAHYPVRKRAAEALAEATGKPAVYFGIDGQAIPSDAFPKQPYPGQDALLAACLLDQVQAAGPIQRPESDRAWQQHEQLDSAIRNLVDEESGFGSGLKTALLALARQRGIADQLKAAAYSLWRE